MVEALELAHVYRGVPAFAAGLRLLPEGEDLALRLDLGEVRSFQHEIRREDDVIAEELYALLSADAGIKQKLVTAASDVFRDLTTCGGGRRWSGAAGSGWLLPISCAQSGLWARPRGDSHVVAHPASEGPGVEARRGRMR